MSRNLSDSLCFLQDMEAVVLGTAGWSARSATAPSVEQVLEGSSPPCGTCSTARRPRSTATPPPAGTATGEGPSTAALGTCPMWTPGLHTHRGKCNYILNPRLKIFVILNLSTC